ncbi:MAG: polyprenyl synthetase family protein [Chloroflexi bacterium]|nr:polyprenyl synthetase family protein [Chloroflexota bacterium]
MQLQRYTDEMLPYIEEELKLCVGNANDVGLEELHQMLAYHLGWEGKKPGAKARGKRIRPMLVLLSNVASGGDWKLALPAAAAVELVHNFSLIHDDIQDNSPLRRGRSTLWKKWGIPQAINAGDSMFALAHLALHPLHNFVTPETEIKIARVLRIACLTLTQGQYLDLAYESKGNLTTDSYWPMVRGKTASLIAACSELGALIAGVNDKIVSAYREFGEYLGFAFQIYDDLLGIWGNASLTGKSAESDLLTGKKSLPVLYALEQNGEFATRWSQKYITAADVPSLAALLEAEGARDYAQVTARRLTEQALEKLVNADPQEEGLTAIISLVKMLSERDR